MRNVLSVIIQLSHCLFHEHSMSLERFSINSTVNKTRQENRVMLRYHQYYQTKKKTEKKDESYIFRNRCNKFSLDGFNRLRLPWGDWSAALR